jgi:hypothetical protein
MVSQKNTPADDAKNEDQIGEAVRREYSELLCVAPKFQDFVKSLDFSAHGVPVERRQLIVNVRLIERLPLSAYSRPAGL